MAAYSDALGLARLKNTEWKLYKLEHDKSRFTTAREEVTSFSDISSWMSLYVPLYVSVKKETDYVSGDVSYFVLAHSKNYKYPNQVFDLYKKRTKIEERHRQLKGCWDLATFSSLSFSLVNT